MSLKVQKAEKGLLKLNVNFRNRKIFLDGDRDEIYSQLEEVFNIDILNSLIISWLPEGDGCCSCCIIDQDQNICFIEINIDNKKLSSCEKSSIDEYKNTNHFKRLKPWEYIRLAIESHNT